ncbi:hypothetical protein L1987_53346 [Smallanthus sonchifolius]|uniref:Uncharacterized protein n=1 Tax=Smallanthus sonchifolius TaxID=185202 RepID=A0ACB9EVL5_9ASTR|nr:hypothetical protein L1987_53346 [Smallanthus sonchifolius]
MLILDLCFKRRTKRSKIGSHGEARLIWWSHDDEGRLKGMVLTLSPFFRRSFAAASLSLLRRFPEKNLRSYSRHFHRQFLALSSNLNLRFNYTLSISLIPSIPMGYFTL